jgi:hypothetical protein
VTELQTSLAELTSQVQQMREQLSALQIRMYVLEFLLLFGLMGGVAIYVWRRVRELQGIPKTDFKAHIMVKTAPASSFFTLGGNCKVS